MSYLTPNGVTSTVFEPDVSGCRTEDSRRPKAAGSAREVSRDQPKGGSEVVHTKCVQASKPPKAAPLGIYARTYSSPSAARVSEGSKKPSPHQIRSQRWALKSAVNHILPQSRTAKCHRWLLPSGRVSVNRSIDHGRCFFSGLQVCGSVWACPLCAAKISERKRAELVSAIAVARAMGKQVMLMTLTVPHGMGDDVRLVVDGILKAWRKTTQGKVGQDFRRSVSLHGTVRSLEVTYGKNGFHPHLHVLLFLNGDKTPEQIQEQFTTIWQNACRLSKLPIPSALHGCKVSDGSYAAAYASKWGLESEMTKSHLKQGKSDSMTPWDFLREVLKGGENKEKYAKLFALYASVFKGKRQLYWSNGLRDSLALEQEKTDEEIASAVEDNADVLAQITYPQWVAIMNSNNEPFILSVAEKEPKRLQEAIDAIVLLNPVTSDCLDKFRRRKRLK